MPTVDIIDDSDHLSFVSSAPSLTPRLRHAPSMANLSRWVVNRISRQSLQEEYSGSDRLDKNQQDNQHSHGYNRRQRRQRRQRQQHRTAPRKEEIEVPQENSEEEDVDIDSDEDRLREEYAAYCRAFTASAGPDHPSSSPSRWTMEASHHPGITSGSSSPGLAAAAGGRGREHEEDGVPSPSWDTLDQSLPQLQPPPRILTPALYVQNQAHAQAQAQRREPPAEDRPVRPWWSSARKWVCARS